MKFDDKQLKERFNLFLEKNNIDTTSLNDVALYVLETGHRYLLIEGGAGE